MTEENSLSGWSNLPPVQGQEHGGEGLLPEQVAEDGGRGGEEGADSGRAGSARRPRRRSAFRGAPSGSG